MIIGIGNDLVHINRIETLIERFGDRFINRSFSEAEIKGARHYPHNDSRQRASYFAKRFAAKEAFAKAIGTGFRGGLRFQHISITNDALGKPVMTLEGYAHAMIEKLKTQSQPDICLHVTLSDDYPLALATVVIELL
jgi:holo-[acyl-carrier protein] synthase